MSRARTAPQVPGDLVDQVTSTVAGWSAGSVSVQDILLAAGFVVAAVLLNWLVRRLTRRVARRQHGPTRAATEFVGQLVGLSLLTVAGAVALESLGFGIGPVLLIVFVVIGVLALAVRPIVQNLGAGLTMQVRGAFRVGDEIETNGVTGRVHEINARALVLITPDNRRIHVPNTDVLGTVIVNLTAFDHRRSEVTLTVWTGTDVAAFRAAVLARTADLAAVLPDPPAEVLVRAFSTSGVVLAVRFWHRPTRGAEIDAVDAVGGAVLGVLAAEKIIGGRALVELTGAQGPD